MCRLQTPELKNVHPSGYPYALLFAAAPLPAARCGPWALRPPLQIVGPTSLTLWTCRLELLPVVWSGLAWLGLVWLGLAWLGLTWLGLAWTDRGLLLAPGDPFWPRSGGAGATPSHRMRGTGPSSRARWRQPRSAPGDLVGTELLPVAISPSLPLSLSISLS